MTRRTLALLLAVPLVLGLLGLVVVQGLQDRWAWRLADLDRNRLNLAMSRGADSDRRLAGWVEHGTVEEATGSVQRGAGGHVSLRVRYEQQSTGRLGQQGGTRTVCYVFVSDDGYQVGFRSTRCIGT